MNDFIGTPTDAQRLEAFTAVRRLVGTDGTGKEFADIAAMSEAVLEAVTYMFVHCGVKQLEIGRKARRYAANFPDYRTFLQDHPEIRMQTYTIVTYDASCEAITRRTIRDCLASAKAAGETAFATRGTNGQSVTVYAGPEHMTAPIVFEKTA